jgi:ABC-2 type transport system ATP-binding protein
MDNAERLCDSVCIIAHGDKVLDGEVAAVKQARGTRNVALAIDGHVPDAVHALLQNRNLVTRVDDQNRYFEIELATGANAQDILKQVIASGASVRRFELISPSLHQIFLERVGAKGVEEGMSGHG